MAKFLYCLSKRKILNFFRWFGLNSRKSPSGLFKHSLKTKDKYRGMYQFKIIREAQSIKLPLPKNVRKEHIPLFTKVSEFLLPPVKLFFLKQVRILADGYIFKGLSVLEESFVLTNDGYLKVHNWKGLLKILITSRHEKLPAENSYVLAHNFFSGYFHWIAETIPRILLVKPYLKDSVLILPEAYTDNFYTETLKLVGVTRIAWLKKGTVYQVPDLIFPSVTSQQQSYNPEMLGLVKSYFMDFIAGMESPINSDKIYISRSRATKRKILNEEAVIQALEKKQFATVNLEDYTFLEQVCICHKARYLISIHGAGLTNMIFMEPGSKVLELKKTDNNEMYYFYALAATLKIDYFYQFCNSDQPELPVMFADIFVDLRELENNVKLMLKS